ncbi:Uncharacterised protein [Mycobacterium tuberculosis]|nr:Uncharacterised protein [Mycobacterium tuberculosis]
MIHTIRMHRVTSAMSRAKMSPILATAITVATTTPVKEMSRATTGTPREEVRAATAGAIRSEPRACSRRVAAYREAFAPESAATSTTKFMMSAAKGMPSSEKTSTNGDSVSSEFCAAVCQGTRQRIIAMDTT